MAKQIDSYKVDTNYFIFVESTLKPMLVRKTSISDLSELRRIYDYARAQMKLNGNPSQWGDSRPKEADIIRDIEAGNSYVIEEEGRTCAVFSFVIGADPTYSTIEDGEWKNNLPYGTIHRLASDGTLKGVFGICLDYCFSVVSTVRIDTHRNNAIMLHLAEKNSFERCGIIYVDDGTPRIAFQKSNIKRVYLVGYMGAGKTSVGKRLASAIGFRFIDLDSLFEEKYKISVDDFFRKYDEPLFRRFESDILRSTSELENCVISAGGGTPCFMDNMRWMNENGKTIFIRVSAATAAQRLAKSKRKRPLLEGRSSDELLHFVSEHYASRMPFYEMAHHTVKGENCSIDDVVSLLR